MTQTQPDKTGAGSALAPFHHTAFAVLWSATVIGNTGTYMRDVASAWLVADLSASPGAVGLIQAAGTLPIFLLALPAGVLADILDRRKLLMGMQVVLLAVSLALTLLAWRGLITVELLIGLTLIGGTAAAIAGPAWQSMVPDLVPRSQLRNAIALNSVGINVSRSIGPAVGGILLGAFGAAFAYAADLATYLFVIGALLWWSSPRSADNHIPEHFLGAFRAGLRYARSSRKLHVVLFRAGVYFIFASATWALLPLVAKDLLGGGASFYGLLLGSVGAGAIGGATVLPRLRNRLSSDAILLGSAVLSAGVMVVLTLAPPQWAALACLFVLGSAWIAALTVLNGVAQAVLPNWVRGRALAVYLTVFNGAMTAGSIFWGQTAEALGLTTTLLIAAAGLTLTALLVHLVKLPLGEDDLSASHHWPEPIVADTVDHAQGPVLVLVEYTVAADDRAAFLRVLNLHAEARRRDGAYLWGVSEDAAKPGQIVEWFLVESWAEHLRQHERASHADAEVHGQLIGFHQGHERPLVRHLIALPGQSRI
ncbi:MFS transporter [Rhizobium sp. RU36D]|uniref:MFS transporter n=1 Tax=Rhizobium sp. RU36D TaxID=1907415 RepID=UPI0009D7CEA3|nr:MFS transporter [Rhizobium sp. RU36D]SMD13791.1 Predicted arabinose efflux permease, MFS family [Rhizobium sp. RU36D]